VPVSRDARHQWSLSFFEPGLIEQIPKPGDSRLSAAAQTQPAQFQLWPDREVHRSYSLLSI
jgi:hypothetical protein